MNILFMEAKNKKIPPLLFRSPISLFSLCNNINPGAELLLGKGALKICSIFTKEHPSRRAISIKLLWNFIEIVLRHGCSPVKLLHIIRTPFPKNTSGPLLLLIWNNVWQALWKNVFPWERLCSGLKWSKTTKNLFWKSTNSAQLIFIEHYHYKNQKTSKVFHNIRIFK